jgi:PIN like domain
LKIVALSNFPLDSLMAIDPNGLRFFVDEAALGLGLMLAIARNDVIHTGHALIPDVPLGALDDEWMPKVAARGLVVITRDKKIRTKHAKTLLYGQYGLRVFAIGSKRDLNNWDTLCLVVRRWDDIERNLKERDAGPWFMAINTNSIVDLPIKDREL